MKKRYTVNFSRHLTDCEFNYRKMCLLMPGWRHYPNNSSDNQRRQWRYLTDWQSTVVMQVVDSAKYTTTVHISMDSQLQNQLDWFKTRKSLKLDNAKPVLRPERQDAAFNLEVRLYHDASLAEVITFADQRRFLPRHEYPNHNMYQQDEKSQLNLFLGEMLDHCLAQGRVEKTFMFSTT